MKEYIVAIKELALGFKSTDLREEVIRCKDCKHYDIQVRQCTNEADWFCIEPNGFCSRAERKEE